MPSNLGPFPHGVSWTDIPTSVIAPVASSAGVNVVFGAAPLHLVQDGRDRVNVPNLFNTYEDAVLALGFSSDWDKYDICEHMDAAFVEFGVFPVIYIPVNDPEQGMTNFAAAPFTLVNGQVDTHQELIAWLIVVKSADASVTYALGTDYLLSLSDDNTWIITRVATGAIPNDGSTVSVSGKLPNANPIDGTDVIGGIDTDTGKRLGLEVIEDVFQKTGLVPGIIICPKWSKSPDVAAAMNAKCGSINGCFSCICLIDVDTEEVTQAADVLEYKNSNNLVSPSQQVLFGRPALVGASATKVFNFASQQGPLMQWVDAYRGAGLPYHSPSNKNLRMNALLLADGTELSMDLLNANMLNGQGVVTALNWIGGWKSWGNRTAAYPANTDVKDMFIPVKRMFNYVGNTVVLTIWQKVDEPGNRRLIDSVVNSLQLWLDGLASEGALLGARIEFRQDENPTTELLNGHYVFHIYIAAPTPAEWLDFRMEYFVPFTENLFGVAA